MLPKFYMQSNVLCVKVFKQYIDILYPCVFPRKLLTYRFYDTIANITFNLNNDKQDTEIASVTSTNCKYFTINELNSQKIDPNKNFSMLYI